MKPAAKTLFLALALAASPSFALTITCPDTAGYDRYATLGDTAAACRFGSGNPQASDINGYFGTDWDNAGEASSGTTLGFLSVELTSGSWGAGDATGTWTIADEFWELFGEAVISIHVGNGRPSSDPMVNEPDHWAFLMEAGASTGTWAYDFIEGQGGGLSNLHLWGRGEPARVSEPASLALLGLGLLGVAATRRKRHV